LAIWRRGGLRKGPGNGAAGADRDGARWLPPGPRRTDKAIAQEDAALEQAAIANARPLERSRIHGDLATGSLTIGYNYEVKNEALVPDRFWIVSDKLIKNHIAAAPKDKAPEPVPGIIFTPIYKARIRA
jgi:hypothetical protein